VTGFTIFEHTIAGKWLELLKEAAPNVSRVAVMQNPEHPAWTAYLNAIGTVAPAVGVQVTPAPVHDAADIERAIDAFAREPNGGLIVLPSGLAVNYRELIIGHDTTVSPAFDLPGTFFHRERRAHFLRRCIVRHLPTNCYLCRSHP
jgi:putative tryptophan/tyrosine transport system substrate-binding protein